MTTAAIDQSMAWHSGLTVKHWRVLWGSYLGWVFDGYEAYALIVVLPMALKSVLTPDQMATPAFYAGSAIGITLLGWGVGGLLGGIGREGDVKTHLAQAPPRHTGRGDQRENTGAGRPCHFVGKARVGNPGSLVLCRCWARAGCPCHRGGF